MFVMLFQWNREGESEKRGQCEREEEGKRRGQMMVRE